MNQPVHLDLAVTNLARVLLASEGVTRALLIEDSLGRVSVGVWGNSGAGVDAGALALAGGPFFSGSLWRGEEHPRGSLLDLERAWEVARPCVLDGQEASTVRRLVRFRTLTSWQFQQEPVWPLAPDDPAVVTFFSYKGGLGRTTALVSFALQRAALGDRVVILDLDLEAPGLDLLERWCEPTPRYGIVDYLLEAGVLPEQPDLVDYHRTVAHPDLVGQGSIAVFPASVQDEEYLGKVARIDLEWELAREAGFQHPLERLLHQIRAELHPDWILIDSRTGFSEVAGLLLSGLAHLHVLFGVHARQSWSGLDRVIRKLGEERLHRGLVQSEVVMVQAMVQSQASARTFCGQAESLFFERYYEVHGSEEDETEDEGLDLLDAEGDDAPHKPIAIAYMPSFAQEVELTDSVQRRALLGGSYAELANRLARRAGREESHGEA